MIFYSNFLFRGECCSIASGEVKNDGRKSADERKLIGAKCDGIVRDLHSTQEYAVAEEAKSWDGKDSTKYLSDGWRKLPKVMHNMLHQKVRNYDLHRVRSSQLEIVGLLHSGKFFYY